MSENGTGDIYSSVEEMIKTVFGERVCAGASFFCQDRTGRTIII